MPRRGVPCASAAAAMVFAALSAPLAGQTPLSEQAAIERALAREGIAARDQAERDVGAAEIAAIRPIHNPALEVSRESAGGETEWQLGVVQPIDLSGRRGSLRDAARAEAEAIEGDVERRRQELVAETRTAFVDCAAAAAELQVWERYAEQLADAERVATARARVGDTAGYDVRRVRVESRSADAQRALAQGDKTAACTLLSSLTGVEDPQVAPAAMTAMANPTAAGDRPDLTAQEQRLIAATQRVTAARRARMPEFAVGAGVKRVNDGMDTAYGPVVSVGVTLPIFSAGGAQIDAAEARQRALEAELAITRRRILAEQQAAAARASAARDAAVRAGRARDDAGLLGTIAETAYQAGETGVVELLDAYEAARDADLSVLSLARRAARASIEFDLATGRSIP